MHNMNCFIAVCVVFGTNAFSATYYISPDGMDNFAGTREQPWKSFSKVNSATIEGDEIVLLKGFYSEPIEVTIPGITIRGEVYSGPVKSAEPATILKNGQLAAVQVETMTLGNNQTVRDLYFSTDSRDSEVGISISGKSNSVINCSFKGGYKHPVSISGTASLNKIQNCIMDGFYRNGVKVSVNQTNLSSGNLIEGNILSNSQVADGVQFDQGFSDPAVPVNRVTVIRNNIIFGNMENGIDLKTSAHVVMEGNIIYGNKGAPDGKTGIVPTECPSGAKGVMFGGHSTRTSKNHIFRNNIVYDNPGGVQMYEGWKIYNNSIVGNARAGNTSGICFEAPAITSGPHKLNKAKVMNNSSAKNNIIGDHAKPFALENLHPSVAIDHNYYYNTEIDLNQWRASLSDAGLKEAEDNSFCGSNPFVNVPAFPSGDHSKYDFSVKEGASVLNGGGYLTKATSTGSGTSMRVDDALYFYDGFGVAQGDEIQLEGTTDQAHISKVDYTTNTLTLSTSLSWHKGQGVSLAYTGSAPDIGAINCMSP